MLSQISPGGVIHDFAADFKKLTAKNMLAGEFADVTLPTVCVLFCMT